MREFWMLADLCSVAPWVMPVRKQRQHLMDGGVVSSLPIEPAMLAGATKIVALDLTQQAISQNGFMQFEHN